MVTNFSSAPTAKVRVPRSTGLTIVGPPAVFEDIRGERHSRLKVEDCTVNLSEFGTINLVDQTVCRELYLRCVNLAPTGTSMTAAAVKL